MPGKRWGSEDGAAIAQTVMEAVAKREEEEKGNAMKALENRTQDSRVEMDIMDALEELQALPRRPPLRPFASCWPRPAHLQQMSRSPLPCSACVRDRGGRAGR